MRFAPLNLRLTTAVGAALFTLTLAATAGCGDDDGTLPFCNGVQCGAYASCETTAEGPTCVCDEGFEGDGQTCTAIDGCAEVSCGDNAHCEAQGDTGSCVCDAGYVADASDCVAVDHCENITCGANEHCAVQGDTGTCVCDAGYELSGATCVAIDYCENVTCGANEHCEQVGHEGLCVCDAGYELNGTDCVVEPFCQGVTCTANAHCEQVGHAGVCFCDDGFEGDGTSCTNIDECTLGLDTCAADATCLDTAPGYDCSCLPGFEGDGYTCQDIDNCTPENNPCDDNAQCANTVGGFTCTCDAGFTGDGTDCADTEAPTFAGLESVTANFDGSLSLTWQPASDNADDAADLVYEICVGNAAGDCDAAFSADQLTAPGATSATVDLGYTQRKYFLVRVRDLAGNRDANVAEHIGTTNPVTYPVTYGDSEVNYNQVIYTAVDLGGTGHNVATVSPGATVSLNFTFRIYGSCGGCYYVGALGLSPADESTTTWFNCFYSGNPIATAPPGDSPASRSVSFTAPTTPGVYHIRTRRMANYHPTCLNPGGSGLTGSIATLTVQ